MLLFEIAIALQTTVPQIGSAPTPVALRLKRMRRKIASERGKEKRIANVNAILIVN